MCVCERKYESETNLSGWCSTCSVLSLMKAARQLVCMRDCACFRNSKVESQYRRLDHTPKKSPTTLLLKRVCVCLDVCVWGVVVYMCLMV